MVKRLGLKKLQWAKMCFDWSKWAKLGEMDLNMFHGTYRKMEASLLPKTMDPDDISCVLFATTSPVTGLVNMIFHSPLTL